MAHTHMTPSVPQYSSHTGWRWEENTSRNRMKLLMNYALGFCFNLLREFFLSTHHMLYIYCPMALTEKGQRITKVNINMKIQSLNIFYWKKKKLQGDESNCKLQERKQASERETTHFSIPRSGQQSHRAPI